MIHDNHVNWNKSDYLNHDTFYCVITRFNIRLRLNMTELQFREFSMDRLIPFTKICAPSIHNQRLPLHRWYVLFDEDFKSTVEQIRPAIMFPGFSPIFVPKEKDPFDLCREQIKADSAGRDFVASIRHDSDDALGHHFSSFLDDMIAVIRKIKPPPFGINFPYQLRMDGDKLGPYIATDSSSMAVWEMVDNIQTGYQGGHADLALQVPLFECGTRYPMVLITRNDSNIGKYAWEDILPLENKSGILKKYFGIMG